MAPNAYGVVLFPSPDEEEIALLGYHRQTESKALSYTYSN
jgi:hypothetical protein